MTKRFLTLLLCLMMVVSLFPTFAFAADEAPEYAAAPGNTATNDDSTGMVLTKTLSMENDGTYTITMEAYATGETIQDVVTTSVPTDIVLVLDQSGSMSKTDMRDSSGKSISRLQALKNAVNGFLGSVSEKLDDDMNPLHRVAIVGFASKNENTEVFNGTSQTPYSTSVDNTVLKSALKWANDSDLKASVEVLDDEGATYSQYGLDLAIQILNAREDADGRNAAVIMFTDGNPGENTGASDGYKTANAAISKAKTLKDNGATVFTVGLLDDDTVLLQDESGTCGGAGDSDYTIAHYMRGVSSDYLHNDSLAECTDANKNTNGIEYYQKTTGGTDVSLDDLFESISQSIDTPTTSVTLDADSILRDVIELKNFTAPTDVQVYTLDVEQASAGAAITAVSGHDWVNATSTYGVTNDKNTGTVEVTAFDYSTKYVTVGHPGQKLKVVMTGLLPKQAGDPLASNLFTPNNKIAGVYVDDNAETPSVKVNVPWTTIGSETYVIDYNYPVKLSENLTTAAIPNASVNGNRGVLSSETPYAAKSGTYTLDGQTLTYQLFTGKVNPSTGAIFSTEYTDTYDVTIGAYGGVDKALFFEAGAWKQVNTLPATSVYYDDDLTDPQAASTIEGVSHNANVTTNTEQMDGDKGKAIFYTFTGTGIEFYCTTHSDGGYVKAQLLDAEGKVVQNGGTKTSLNYSEDERYNTPTLWFTGLDYGTYTVRVYAAVGANYLFDGVRVYDPAGVSDKATGLSESAAAAAEEANEIYADESLSEQNATFTTLRGMILDGITDENAATVPASGIGYFTDRGDEESTGYKLNEETNEYEEVKYPAKSLGAYEVDGPKNEVYLEAGTALAFTITNWDEDFTGNDKDVKIMVGLSACENEAVTVNIGGNNFDISSPMDMYYELTVTDGNVSIQNVSGGLLAVTKLKVSGGDDPIVPTLADITPAKATTLAVTDGDGNALTADANTIPMYLAVTPKTVSYAAKLNAIADGAVEEIPEDVNTPDTPNTPDQPDTPDTPDTPSQPDTPSTPSVATLVRQIISSFVSSLFRSMGRLFGN